MLYYDLDDEAGAEELQVFTYIGDEKTIGQDNLTYTTTNWTDGGYDYISWLGDKYRVVDLGQWVISEELVDEDEDDDHLLRVGESLSLPEGFAISAIEIDVDGDEAWLSLTKDGEEIDNEVVSTVTGDQRFVYEDDFDEADDVEIIKFTVETVFAGMNTNLVKINNISLVSMDLLEVETGSDEPFNDYSTTTSANSIRIVNDEDISLKEDGTTEVLDGAFIIRVNEDGTLAALAKEITEPGIHELFGAVNQTPTGTEYFNIHATSRDNPSMLYYDLDDEAGAEELQVFTYIGDEKTIGQDNLTYTTTNWTDGGYDYISWLGDKYRVVDLGQWVISEELVDEDEDDDHLLRVGESLSLPEGFAISAIEIDVDGDEAWLSLTKDGEEIDNEVVSTVTGDQRFVYEDDFDEADDVEIIKFTVETVFAGMNTNLVKINNISLVSMDLLEVETGSDEPFNDYSTTTSANSIRIVNDEDISLKEDGTTEILDGAFTIRVNEDGTLAALAKEINIGGPRPTEVPTEVGTEVATDEPTNETGVETGAPTEGPTADTGETETPTPEPTEDEVPGFEAVFAIAGLLAVAYLVLRQRE